MIRLFRFAVENREQARAALRDILEQAAGKPVTIEQQAHGKPYLPEFPRLKFNLSHTKGMALVALAEDIEVGVDIERPRRIPDFELIAERYLPPGDAEALAAIPEPDREREFFRRWTRAEALWKAAGLGLHGAGAVPEGDWRVYDIDVGPDYVAAVAADREVSIR